MPISVEIRDRHLQVIWSGTITTDDLGTLFRELPAAAMRCGFTPHVLHTMDSVGDLELGTWDACDYSLRRARTEIPAKVRAAFVASTPVAGAMARVFASFNRNPNLEMATFPDRDEALRWLLPDAGGEVSPGGGPAANLSV